MFKGNKKDKAETGKPENEPQAGKMAAAFASKQRMETKKKSKEKKSSTKIKKMSIMSTETTTKPLLGGGESTPRRQTMTPPTETQQYQASPTAKGSNPSSPAAYLQPGVPSMKSSGDDFFDKYEAPFAEGTSGSNLKTDTQISEMTSQTFTDKSQGGSGDSTANSGTITAFTDPEEAVFGETSKEVDVHSTSTLETDNTGSQGEVQKFASHEDDDQFRYTLHGSEVDGLWSHSEGDTVLILNQKVAWMSILLSASQLAILIIQLILCGVASLEVNPMIGPYPDAFSEWGGKNAYLLLDEKQYYRVFTPAFLHVGVVHLLVNVFCQLEPCALFEREWGSGSWLIVYFVGTAGSVIASCMMNPNDISVASSGAVMALFGAKIAQIVTYAGFDMSHTSYLESVSMNRMATVLCSVALVFIMTCVTYIDMAGHVGGVLAGFLCGMCMFCRAIKSGFIRYAWCSFGLFGLIGAFGFACRQLYVEIYPDEELGDACNYFRHLYPEGYECECQWG